MGKGVCQICLDHVQNRAVIWCFHVFCYSCLFEWFKLKNECPVCRNPFCIMCGLNPKGTDEEYNKCHCNYEHKNATVCNFCGEWAPEHGDEQNCPRRPSPLTSILGFIARSREFPRLGTIEENNSEHSIENNSGDEESSEDAVSQLMPDSPIRVVFDSKNISSELDSSHAEENNTDVEEGSSHSGGSNTNVAEGSSRDNNISHIRVMPEINISYNDIRDLEYVLRLLR